MEGDELPAGWALATLAQLGQWTSGGTPSKKRPDYHNGHIPWVLTGDLDDGAVKDVPNGITDAGLKNSSAKIFPPGTLLMAMYGATIGKLGVLQREAATNQACAALLPSEANNQALPYVYFYLLSKREQFKKAGKGGAQPNISQGVIKDTAIPVAPLPEQQRIVEKIETLFAELDKGEEALREVQKLLARYRQSVLKAAVTGTLTADWRAANGPPGETGQDLLNRILETRRTTWQGRGKYKEPVEPETDGLPELPEGWVWASVDQLSSSKPNALCIGPFGSNLRVEDYRDEGVPLIFVRHIRANDFTGQEPKFVSPEKAHELSSHRAFPGDLLVTKMGDPPGDVAIYPYDAPTAIITADCIRFALSEDGLSKSFIIRAIQSRLVQAQIGKISKGVAQQKVTLANFKKVAIPLPPSGEQNEIAELADVEMDRIERAGEMASVELRRGAALRQSILKDAFSGKLVPQDPSDETAEKLLDRIRAARAEKPKAKRKKAVA